LASGILAVACSNQADDASKATVSQADLEALVAEYPMFSGSAIVAEDGEITASVHLGLADQLSGQMNTVDTLHSIASVGKMFTSVAIAQLVEAGELTYETSVIDVIPELIAQMSPNVTIDHLLHHTSGLMRISNVDDVTLDALRTNTDYFALIVANGIRSTGPSDFAYRNENYQILGEVVTRISDQPYEQYIRDHIASPLGMTGPSFVRRDLDPTQMISNHYLPVDFETWWNSEESIVAADVNDFVHPAPPATPSAGGGAYATAHDLIRFATALRNGTLISQTSFNANCELINDGVAVPRGYGRGCLIRMDGQNSRVGHTGSTAGIQARFFMYTERNLDVIVISNHDEQAVPVFTAIDSLIRSR